VGKKAFRKNKGEGVSLMALNNKGGKNRSTIVGSNIKEFVWLRTEGTFLCIRKEKNV
jgi:hypothetical protein